MKPEDIHPMFAAAFNAGDLERRLAFYEPEAKLMPAGGPLRSGTAEIRDTLQQFLAGCPQMTIKTAYSIRMGDIALVQAEWRLLIRRADKTESVRNGRSAEVARRQPDGRWLYIIDYPVGGDLRP